MPPTPKAVRIKTADGWQDISVIGAQGPPGPMRELAAVTFGNITSTAAPGALVADFGTLTFDGQPITVELSAGFIDLRTNSNAVLYLHDFITGSDVQVARIAYWREAVTTDSGGQWMPVHVIFRFTPTAGNHRYRIRFQTDAGYSGLNALDSPPNYARLLKAAGVSGGGLDAGTFNGRGPLDYARDWYTAVPTEGANASYLGADCLAFFGLSSFTPTRFYQWEYFFIGHLPGGADHSVSICPNNAYQTGVSHSRSGYTDGSTNWDYMQAFSNMSLVIGHTNWNSQGWMVARGTMMADANPFYWSHSGTMSFRPYSGNLLMNGTMGGFCGCPNPTTSMMLYNAGQGFGVGGTWGLRPVTL